MSERRYAVSRDGEFYDGDYPTRADAVECAEDHFEVHPGMLVYVGEVKPYTPRVSGSFVADRLADDTCDEVPDEIVGDWPNLTREQEDALGAHLTTALHEWLRANGKWPTFFSVENTTEHRLPESVGVA